MAGGRRSLDALLVGPSASLRDAMERIDRTGAGIVVVVDAERRLLGTVTDGDLRRAVLAGRPLDATVGSHLEERARAGGRPPLSAAHDVPPAERLARMRAAGVRHLPVLDAEGRLADVDLLSDYALPSPPPLRALVMAGGSGRRLMPLTAETPKPMLPLDGRPVLEHVLERLRDAGVRRVEVATHHLPHVIEEHFGDGSALGLDIRYVREEHPLGTAGALAHVDPAADDEPILVVNGDVVTRVDLRALRDFHDEHGADLTVAVHVHQVPVPFGVLELDGPDVRGIREKPVLEQFVAAGIYLVGPRPRRLLEKGRRADMPDLIRRGVEAGLRLVAFPVREYWVDIGRLEDYERARADVRTPADA